MTPAPLLLGYVCKLCGQETIQSPWDATEGYPCKPSPDGCGAVNWGPLTPKPERPYVHDLVEVLGGFGLEPK